MLIIISILLIPFFAFREIGQVIGERELHSLIFTRKRSLFAGAAQQLGGHRQLLPRR